MLTYIQHWGRYDNGPANFTTAQQQLSSLVAAGQTRVGWLERARLYKVKVGHASSTKPVEVQEANELARLALVDLAAWEKQYGARQGSGKNCR